jgi:transcriptional regulator with XRE-family HTH domain
MARHRRHNISDPVKKRWAALVMQIRAEKDETQEQFASRFGIASQSVQQWESQGSLPNPDNREIMSGILGWTTDELNSYLKTGTKIDAGGFDLPRTIAQLRTQDPQAIVELINEASSLLRQMKLISERSVPDVTETEPEMKAS